MNNTATNNGGGIYIDDVGSSKSSTLRVTNTTIENNRAGRFPARGGELAEKMAHFSLTLTQNFARACHDLTFVLPTLTGGIYGARVGIIVEGSRIVSNAAADSGGGMYVQLDSTLRVANTTVENNIAGDRGGEQVTHFAAYSHRTCV